MPLPLTGTLSINDFNVELEKEPTAQGSLGDSDMRGMAGRVNAGSEISFFDFYGKSATFMANLAGGTNINLRTLADAAGYPGTGSSVHLTLTSTAISNSTGVPAVNLGTWPDGTNLYVVINATVLGYGGGGGAGGYRAGGGGGGAGGPAIRANAITSGSVTIELGASGIVRGGGGGGGGGSGGQRTVTQDGTYYYTGGNGGRGAGAQGGATAGAVVTYAGNGGNGGGYGAAGAYGASSTYSGGPGGAGGAALINSGLCTLINWSGNYSGSLS